MFCSLSGIIFTKKRCHIFG